MSIRLSLAAAALLGTAATAPALAQAGFRPALADMATVNELALPPPEVQAAVAAQKGEPLRFAVSLPVSAGVEAGSWSAAADGVSRWRLRLRSDGAESLAAQIESLSLPPGAELWFYGADGRDVQGPLRSTGDGRLSTPLVRDDVALLEARVPAGSENALALRVTQVFHGFKPFDSASAVIAKGAFGNSGACNIDVACSAGDAWSDEIRSVVLLTLNNEALCTGTLVNNALQNRRAFILTANHCGIRRNNFAGVRAYFNTQKTSCSSTANGRVDQNIAAGALRAGSPGETDTDFTLLELASVPPDDFNVYYAGWDVAGAAPRSGVSIHHPSGDDKKIAVFTQAATALDDVGYGVMNRTADVWQVTWAQGTTEPGSSGSGLWSQNKRIVGTLSGGDAACDIGNSSVNNGLHDRYARLCSAWSAPSSTGVTLKGVLDAENSGCLALNGRDFQRDPSTPASCAATTANGPCGPQLEDGDGEGGGALTPVWLLALLALSGWRLGRRRRSGAPGAAALCAESM